MSSSSQARHVVAQRYGRVLFEMASDENTLPSILKDVNTLASLLEAEENEWRLLTNPTISREDQTQMISSLAKTLSLKDLTVRFLKVLSQNGRLPFLNEVLKIFHVAHSEAQGKIQGTIETAQPLSKTELAGLEKKLSQDLDKEVTLKPVIKSELLGGAILKVGTLMVDASFGSRLTKLKTVMMKG
ncbi:ATP synthase F1 complex subunit delta [Candidatus Bealeia paramacronuclearis]|uniref:ATP synthase subunit delta n=1 Tax=Candidatus Bealeia paramacronuclearis TaxID=1921001 RepID=A0ABZ2C584_9PROT|nr:ATP synthase F1 complex subunit delta [Candidatus Bealeia paramacronuclearis]